MNPKIGIALLRGINVGGRNKIKMAELKSVLTAAGLSDVQTYIQSGNIVFVCAGALADAATMISDCIREHFALAIPVVVRSAAEWTQILHGNPYAAEGAADTENWHYMLLDRVPDAELLPAIAPDAYSPDRFMLQGDTVYLHITRFADTKLSNALFDRKWKVIATVRNHKTMWAIQAIVEEVKRRL